MKTFAYIFTSVALAGFVAAPTLAKSVAKKPVSIDCASGTIQAAVDAAIGPATIFVSGTCTENVTITKDDITLSGNEAGVACIKATPGGSGTIDGTITVDGVRATIEFLTITGGGEGVRIENRATTRLTCNDISANEEIGVVVWRSSNAVLRDNTVSGNGTRESNTFIFLDCGLFAADASSVRSDGNTYADNEYCAIEIDRQASFRSGDFLPREPGHPANPDDRDVITQRGCTPSTGAGCNTSDGGPVAIEIFTGGMVDLRNAEVNGEIEVFALSTFRVDGDVAIQGNITASFGSMARLRDRSFFGDRAVTFTGTLTCTDTSQAAFSNVQCGQTCSGSIPGSCTP